MEKTFKAYEQSQNTYQSFKTDEASVEIQSTQPHNPVNPASISQNATAPMETYSVPRSGSAWTFPLLQQRLESITASPHRPTESQV